MTQKNFGKLTYKIVKIGKMFKKRTKYQRSNERSGYQMKNEFSSVLQQEKVQKIKRKKYMAIYVTHIVKRKINLLTLLNYCLQRHQRIFFQHLPVRVCLCVLESTTTKKNEKQIAHMPRRVLFFSIFSFHTHSQRYTNTTGN